MICAKCKQPNSDENNFCTNCGAPLPATGRITLKDLLKAGQLKANDTLTMKFKGQEVTATLLADGKIKYQDKIYDGPQACANAVTGQACDSWFCWSAVDHANGRSHGIAHYRSALLGQRVGSR